MPYFKIKNGRVAEVVQSWSDDTIGIHDIETFEDAESVAEQATEVSGDTYLPVDNGKNVWPRYEVIKAPAVGDQASCIIDNEMVACGPITSIGERHRRITTADGKAFYRGWKAKTWRYNSLWILIWTSENSGI